MIEREIIIYSLRPPAKKKPEEDLEWLCKSLGLIGPRDKDKTTMRILKFIIDNTRKGNSVNLEEISNFAEISKAAALHHLEKLFQRGLITKAERKYELRMFNIEETINEMHRDMERMFSMMRKISEEMDEEMGFTSR
ncbi:MAG: hypothetical protein JXA43_03575 [Candidatus Diapherotrites archaeon]|nr:hypothetical protein [Candidatus Diapherotrites archaeon]